MANEEDVFNCVKTFVQDVLKNESYKPEDVEDVEFNDNFELSFDKGLIVSQPKFTKPISAKQWTLHNAHQIACDFEAKGDTEIRKEFIPPKGRLLRDIIYANLHDNLDELERLKSVFSRNKEGSPLYCSIKFSLNGVGLEGNSFEFSFDDVRVILKHPNMRDLKDHYLENIKTQKYHSTENTPTLIAEIIFEDKGDDTHRKAWRERDILWWTLSLLGVGSVRSDSSKITSENLNTCEAGGGGMVQDGRYFYCLNSAKLEVLQKLYPALRKGMVDASWVQGPFNSSQVAYERYTDSLYSAVYGSHLKNIAYAVMGLEALFVSDNTEVSYKLKMRASLLMKIIGHPYDCSKLLSAAYNVRSGYAHGSTDFDKRLIKAGKLISESDPSYNAQGQFSCIILDILRLSLLFVLLADIDKQRGLSVELQECLDKVMQMDNSALAKLYGEAKQIGFNNII